MLAYSHYPKPHWSGGRKGSFKPLTDANYALYEVKYGASSGALTERSTQLHIQMVAATNYKMGDTKRRTD